MAPIAEPLAVLKSGALTTWNQESRRALKKSLSQLTRSLRFSLSVSGPAESVGRSLTQGLVKEGFLVGAEAPFANYELVGTTNLDDKGPTRVGAVEGFAVQATLDLDVLDPATHENVGSMHWIAHGNEKNEELARKAAVRALGWTVEKTIADRLMNLY